MREPALEGLATMVPTRSSVRHGSGYRVVRGRGVSRLLCRLVTVMLVAAGAQVVGGPPANAEAGGAVRAWGRNDYGQSTVPAAAKSGVVGIAAGDFHNLTVKSDGGVLAWGDDDPAARRLSPVASNASVGLAFAQFSLPTSGSWPMDVAVGSGGTVWVTEHNANKVAKVSITGSGVSILEYGMWTSSSEPARIAKGPDGNMWVTEDNAQEVSKVTSAGAVTSYGWPNFNYPVDIAAGPDGNLWVPGGTSDKVSMLTTSGAVTPYAFPGGSLPVEITAGPDGNLWVTEAWGNRVAKLTTSGSYTEYTLPTTASEPRAIAAGPDGNLWVVEMSGDKVARVTPDGVVTEYALPTKGSKPWGITAGPDGNLWVTETNAGQLARVSTSGDVTEYALPPAGSRPLGIVTGPDGDLWVAVANTNSLLRIDPMATVAFAKSGTTVQENVGTASLVVTRTGDTSGAGTVHYAVAAGSAVPGKDFTLPAGDLSFTAGQASATVTLPVIDDPLPERPETVVVVLSDPSPGTRLGILDSATLTIKASDQRPDAWVSTAPASGYVGNNIYNTTAAGQTKNVNARRTQTRTFYSRVYNDGNFRNTFSIKGSASPTGTRVRYYHGTTDVTTRLLSAAGWQVNCAPAGYVLVRAVIHLTSTARIGATKSARVTATWLGDGTRRDGVRGTVHVVR